MRYLLTLLTLVVWALTLSAQVIDPQNFVVENVHVAAQSAKDDSVNLLIRRDKLELISGTQSRFRMALQRSMHREAFSLATSRSGHRRAS